MINPLLLIDFYKASHRDQYPSDVTQIWSNWTPRSSRVEGQTTVVHFGLQYFIKDYLIRRFNHGFFDLPLEVVLKDYCDVMRECLGIENPKTDHIEWLHQLGYLPIDIWSIPEGFSTPLNVPSMVITNTRPEAFWLPNYLETMLSMVLWKPSTSATTATRFREIGEKYAKLAGETDLGFVNWQFHDFSMRGMSGLEDAVLSGMGHLLSFSGTDSVPAIMAARDFYAATLKVGGSVPACYDDQTEILTENGFKLFKDLSENERVAQYHSNGTIDFVVPSAQFACPYDGPMIKFEKLGYRYVDACVTPNHNMVRRHKQSGLVDTFEAGAASTKNSNYSHRFHVIVAGRGIGRKNILTAVERLRIAFQADGAFASRKIKYTGERTNTLPIRFSFKKDRKFDRLIEILDDTGYEYTHEKYDSGYYSFWIKTPMDADFQKDLEWVNLADISSEWAKSFLEELSHWDGTAASKNTIVYSSTVKSCAEKAQIIGILADCKTQWYESEDARGDRQRNYTITFTLSKNSVTGAGVIKTITDPFAQTVYCVSVPTGMLVVRHNRVIVISGNTEHSVSCAGGEDGELETFRRLIEDVYPSGVISLVSDTWDLWNVCTVIVPKLKDSILKRKGRIVLRPDSGNPVKIILGDPESSDVRVQKGVIRLLAEALGTTPGPGGLMINNAAAIYGDSINEERAEAILAGLVAMGFSPYNMIFGIGSFTYEWRTRDTYGFAMKATAVRKGDRNQPGLNGTIIPIFKCPVTDDPLTPKKSHKGIPAVYREDLDRDEQPTYYVHENATEYQLAHCEFRKVFSDGKLLIDEDFETIRKRARG